MQGSRSDPYEVTIRLGPYDETEWKEIVETFRHQPYFAAALLVGEMPAGVEAVVERAGVTLFPEREADLETDYSCPDCSNPCKHIAAVYLLLAEEFDRDPFLLFRLRGMRQGALMDRLGSDEAPAEVNTSDTASTERSETDAAPLSVDGFWDTPDVPDEVYGPVEAPPTHVALPKQLGTFPFWRGGEKLVEMLEPVYNAASTESIRVFEKEEAFAESS